MNASRVPRFLFDLLIVILLTLFAIGIVKDYTDSPVIIALIGLATTIFFALGLWVYPKNNLSSKGENKTKGSVTETYDPSRIPWWQTEGRPYKFIFTHEEEVLNKIESLVSAHPKVKNVYQDAGNWYSNGETGDEWFSMHVVCQQGDSDELQEFICDKLKERGSYSPNFHGSYNT